jgi:amino acid transporter
MSRKLSKGVANTALVVKFIPLFVVIIGGIVFMSMGSFYPITPDQLPGTDPYSPNMFLNIMAVIPAILFAFNGFISSASLMPETKNPKTYQRALVIGMTVVAAVYIAYTIFTFTSIDPNNASAGYGLEGAIIGIFGANVAQ